ncbi:redoxin domain-containing protein [uncultured Hymenobacter sp.]|uniref:redoxin domain-containing protein n=1 Tax=uncultured Hymenobacter sp. TaxID=170016 RepID=UPI0035CBDEA7
MFSRLYLPLVLALGLGSSYTTTIPAVTDAGSISAAGGYELRGTLLNAPLGIKVVMVDSHEGKHTHLDSTQVDANGQFVLRGKVPEPALYQLHVGKERLTMPLLVPLANNVQLRLTGDAAQLSTTYWLEGSPEAALLLQFRALRTRASMQYVAAMVEKRSKENVPMATPNEPPRMDEGLMQASRELQAAANKQLIRQNTSSYVAAYQVTTLARDEKQRPFVDSMAIRFQQALPNSRYTKYLADHMRKAGATAIGKLAPDVKLTTPEGKELALSSLRGKYVLIDFWASWCGPCRQENPSVIKLYQKYKDKGFDIYSISLDDSKEKWVKAIATDGLPWKHVSDLKGWKSAAGVAYGVESIPQTLLLDPKGHIVAKNLRGPELEVKIASLLP